MENIVIREYEEKDIAYIINSHRGLYDLEYGFSSEFGDYVEKYLNKFHKNHEHNKEKIFIAEKYGEQVGSIAIVKGEEASSAQLRWFLVAPVVRGQGLGNKLVELAIDFSKQNNYNHLYLWTVNILEPARHIYKKHGFKLTEELENNTWTNEIIKEERWDLYL